MDALNELPDTEEVETIDEKEIEEELKEINSDEYINSINQYYRDLSIYTLMTPEEEKCVVKRMQDGDNSARQELIERNLRLVVYVAKKYVNCGLDFEDLIQEGSLGLIRATETFSLDKGVKFSTYAFFWVKQSIRRAIDNSGLIRIPVHVSENMKKLNRWIAIYEEENMRYPSEEEINEKCKEIGIEPYTRHCYLLTHTQSSLNKAVNEDDDSSIELGDMLSSEENVEGNVIDLCVYRGLKHELENTLTEKERYVIVHRYIKDETLEAIGKRLGLTRERIRQLEKKAILKLRHPAARRRILSTGMFMDTDI